METRNSLLYEALESCSLLDHSNSIPASAGYRAEFTVSLFLALCYLLVRLNDNLESVLMLVSAQSNYWGQEKNKNTTKPITGYLHVEEEPRGAGLSKSFQL